LLASWSLVVVDVYVVDFTIGIWISILVVELLLLCGGSSKWNLMLEMALVMI
jgi:hypothetical protein